MDNDHTVIAGALSRARDVVRHRPQMARVSDSVATARWSGGLRVEATHPDGHTVVTDLPTELGGSGTHASPGWLMRAGLASCATTYIAMAAADAGIALDELEATVTSHSDLRGLLGLPGDDGGAVSAGPGDIVLAVRIAARGVPAERLRALATTAGRTSPVSRAIEQQADIRIEVDVHVDAQAA